MRAVAPFRPWTSVVSRASRLPYSRRFGSSLATARRGDFGKITAEDVHAFRTMLGAENPGAVISTLDPGSTTTPTTVDDLAPYNTDWMGKYHGQSRVVLRPRTTDEVSLVMKYCHDRRLPVVPQGGNTGLVGGGVPVFDEIVLSTANLNQITAFDEVSGVVTCQAGCILETVDSYLADRGFMMPLDLGAKGSCHIGGNVATNAGGLRVLRYGSLRGTVLGVEAVLADGTVLSDGPGSEGTLGIITAVSILTPRRPKSINLAVLGVDSFQRVQDLFARAKVSLGETLSAFEFWDASASNLVATHMPHVRRPLDSSSPFYVLIETAGSCKEHDEEKLTGMLESVMEEGVVEDGVVAQDASQMQALWDVREGIPEACSKSGSVMKYDISMPVPVLYQLVEDVSARLRSRGLLTNKAGEWQSNGDSLINGVVGYGHVGDGNLHLNISARSYHPDVVEAVEPYVYEWTQRHGGSISAEHGLGQMKAAHIHYSKSPAMVEYMRRIKRVFDPKGIMNPYKFLPEA